MILEQDIKAALDDAKGKAWKALVGYKFWMFGYYVGRWVNCNRLLRGRYSNLFSELVEMGMVR